MSPSLAVSKQRQGMEGWLPVQPRGKACLSSNLDRLKCRHLQVYIHKREGGGTSLFYSRMLNLIQEYKNDGQLFLFPNETRPHLFHFRWAPWAHRAVISKIAGTDPAVCPTQDHHPPLLFPLCQWNCRSLHISPCGDGDLISISFNDPPLWGQDAVGCWTRWDLGRDC